MIDRKKVIKGLGNVANAIVDGYICEPDQAVNTIADAIDLLKEQETVEPETRPSAKGYWYTCGACGWWLFEVRDTVHFDYRKRIRFCASCGRSVKWE